MKNAKLLAEIANHIKTVPMCEPTYGVMHIDEAEEVCLMANAYKAGIISKELAQRIQFEEGFAEYFDVPKAWAERVLYYDDHKRDISGELYYELCKELLEKCGENLLE